jgi:hypothetical protein
VSYESKFPHIMDLIFDPKVYGSAEAERKLNLLPLTEVFECGHCGQLFESDSSCQGVDKFDGD